MARKGSPTKPIDGAALLRSVLHASSEISLGRDSGWRDLDEERVVELETTILY